METNLQFADNSNVFILIAFRIGGEGNPTIKGSIFFVKIKKILKMIEVLYDERAGLY